MKQWYGYQTDAEMIQKELDTKVNPFVKRLQDQLAAKDAEIARLSTREDELNALCLDYQIDLDAARQEIARLRTALAPILAHADSHDYAPPLKFSVQQCRDIKEKADE